MARLRAADDFATIRARLDELRRERGTAERAAPDERGAHVRDAQNAEPRDATERRYRERREGLPPPWAPTIFVPPTAE